MADWIWYPGEFEQRTLNSVDMRRYHRERVRMPLWKLSPIYPLVKFIYEVELQEPEQFIVRADGLIEVTSPKGHIPFKNGYYNLQAGKHRLVINVCTDDGRIPCVYVAGKQILSGAGWKCTLMDGIEVDADYGGFEDIKVSPNNYNLTLKKMTYTSKESRDGFILYDFGRETFGYICLEDTNQSGSVELFFGESLTEVLDFDNCYMIDKLDTSKGVTKTEMARAFRYVAVKLVAGASYKDIHMLYEYNPQKRRAKVKFADTLLQNIWDVSMYTLKLNTREFFLDGIKRDRWVWSGDATQSYLMNWYSFFDEETAARTEVALAGKTPITQHINTIPDYTLFWIISFYDNYLYTNNLKHIKMWANKCFELADFVLSRSDGNYRLTKRSADWVFIDWGPGCTNEVDSYSFLQILLYKAMLATEKVARLVDKSDKATQYARIAESVLSDLHNNFWLEKEGAFTFGLIDNKPDRLVLRQPNIMAMFYGIASKSQREAIVGKVLLSDKIPSLQTPYMRFYENSVLCEEGMHDMVLNDIKNYWGGMLKLGATTFWELYNPSESGAEHYAMYGLKYGKSLCHAWGASPIWLLGRYFFGLQHDKEGSGKYYISPRLKDLGDFEAVLPLKQGDVEITHKDGTLTVLCAESDGEIEYGEQIYIVNKGKKWTSLST